MKTPVGSRLTAGSMPRIGIPRGPGGNMRDIIGLSPVHNVTPRRYWREEGFAMRQTVAVHLAGHALRHSSGAVAQLFNAGRAADQGRPAQPRCAYATHR